MGDEGAEFLVWYDIDDKASFSGKVEGRSVLAILHC